MSDRINRDALPDPASDNRRLSLIDAVDGSSTRHVTMLPFTTEQILTADCRFRGRSGHARL